MKSKRIRSRKTYRKTYRKTSRKTFKKGGNLFRQMGNVFVQRADDFSGKITFSNKEIDYYITKLNSIHLPHNLIVNYLQTLDTTQDNSDEPFNPPFDDFRLFIRRINYKRNCQKQYMYDSTCKQIADLFKYLNNI